MVIDSSALLSYLRDESGAEKVQAMLGAESLKVTVVNWAETQGKLEGSGLLQQRIIREKLIRLAYLLEVLPIGLEYGDEIAFWYARKSPYTLSLADAVCIGVAQVRAEAIMTAEKNWAKLPNLKVEVKLIR